MGAVPLGCVAMDGPQPHSGQAAPASIPVHRYALVGDWLLTDGERQVLQSDTGEIRMRWKGAEINLVLGPDDASGPVTGEVWMDGSKIKDITVDRYDLYTLYTGDHGEHELVLKLKGKGVAGYAFTFGSWPMAMNDSSPASLRPLAP